MGKKKLFKILDNLNYRQFIEVSRSLISMINGSNSSKEEISPQLCEVVDECFRLAMSGTGYGELERYISVRIYEEDPNSIERAKELLDSLF